jgi:Spy/CpxP family protein refolding chaperone
MSCPNSRPMEGANSRHFARSEPAARRHLKKPMARRQDYTFVSLILFASTRGTASVGLQEASTLQGPSPRGEILPRRSSRHIITYPGEAILPRTATRPASMKLIAACTVAILAGIGGMTPATAASTPSAVLPSLEQVLRDISYLAPLSGVTLTTTQQGQIAAIEKAGWTKLIPQIGTVIRTHEEIIGKLAQPGVSIVAIKALEKQKAAALVTIETGRIEMAVAVHSLLTPEQITQEAATHQQQVVAIEAWIKKILGE